MLNVRVLMVNGIVLETFKTH